ncbi:hypothetical protein Hanom_Chr10g00925831 [Helianthus anomalus]
MLLVKQVVAANRHFFHFPHLLCIESFDSPLQVAYSGFQQTASLSPIQLTSAIQQAAAVSYHRITHFF